MQNASKANQEEKPNSPAIDPIAGVLSYLIPGLGQIYQGRISKGILFLVCLYGLFFVGMSMGDWRNVYLADSADNNNPWHMPHLAANLLNRPQFAGQFWVGIAAWPAIYQYYTSDQRPLPHTFLGSFQRSPDEDVINALQRNSDKSWDLAWVYTVIAGVLNVLVIYDAAAGPAFVIPQERRSRKQEASVP